MCRDFSDESIPEAVIERLLDAALGAPAAGNTHGLDLLVLTGEDTLRYWNITMDASRRADFRWQGLFDAPVLVIPYVHPGAYVERYSEPDKVESGLSEEHAWPVPYWFVDGGAAVMAILLAAQAEGLGALLFGQFTHEEAVRREFGVPSSRRAIGTVALGYPAAQAATGSLSAGRGRPSRESHVHRGTWAGAALS